jgi:hypothetical protein
MFSGLSLGMIYLSPSDMKDEGNITKLRQEIWTWAKKSGLNKRVFFSVPINRLVFFSPKGIKHSISMHHGYPELELNLVKQLPKILVDAYYVGFNPNNSGDQSVVGVHDFYNIVVFEAKIYEIWLKVKETKEKAFYYDHGIIRELK